MPEDPADMLQLLRSRATEWWCMDDDKQLFVSDDPRQWVASFAKYHRVGDDDVGRVRVSTIFLGVGARSAFPRQPQLFETMVFGPQRHILDQARYATWQEAESGHRALVGKWREIAG